MIRPPAAPPDARVTGLPVREASALVMTGAAPLAPEMVPLDGALGRVLASDIVSPVALPPWDNSSMDGYAVRAIDVAGASAERPVTLRVIESVAAGEMPTRRVGRGEATRVMTGAPVPEGADSVVRVEDTDAGESEVAVVSARDAGRNVRPRGEDVAAGNVALPAGTALGAAQIAFLASVGAARLPVHRRPRVAILATGDELVPVGAFDRVRAGRAIVSSNSYAVAARVREAGAEPIDLGIARDDPADIRTRIAGAPEFDLLLTTGGVSVGSYDYTREVLASLGAALALWRIRIRPGAPLGFGTLESRPWLGLPGNPVSTLVTFEIFARPLIRRMLGYPLPFRRAMPVRVAEAVQLAAPLTHFLRATVTAGEDGTLEARLTGPQGSGLLSSMARANALLIVPAERREVAAGEMLRAWLMEDDTLRCAELDA